MANQAPESTLQSATSLVLDICDTARRGFLNADNPNSVNGATSARRIPHS